MTVHDARVLVATCMAGLLAALLSAGVAAHAATPAPKQQTFASPDDAVQALVAAARANDEKALHAIFGPAGKNLVDSGDPADDREARARFVASWDESHSLEKDGDAKATIVVGKEAWPLPVPIVKDGESWRFDTAAGQDEVIARRIGRNELDAIQSSLAYVDAQREYYERNPEKSALLHYARRFGSSPNKRDGLYYPTQPGEDPSPLGELFAEAKAHGWQRDKSGKPTPYNGYYFKILEGQGPHAAGGAYDYLARGVLLGGFGLLAYPATWNVSGVMSFIVNQDGVVYQKDLGPKTGTLAPAITRFDPDESWKKVEDQDENPIVDAQQ